ncbi:MAG: methylmalonyl-CoA mutase family protein, partial [Chitinophagaceae bacterium]
AAQEIAFTLANGKAYVQAAMEKGLDINQFGRRISFFFNAHNHLFEEIAKFRAARRMWSKIMKDLGATDPKAMMLRFHTQTGGSTLTAQQPMNNITRVTIQSLAAVMGGTQSLHTNGYDEALGLPTEEAARIALRTQQIIANESGIADVADPLAGSYLIESMTDEMEKKANEWIEKIHSMGGSIAAIENGFIQSEIARSSYAYQQSIEKNERIIVGLNKFSTENEMNIPRFSINEKNQEIQIERLQSFKNERNFDNVQNAILQLRDAAIIGTNIMPHVINCVEKSCTLGEISNILRNIYGEMK